jgi:hypothetical protein
MRRLVLETYIKVYLEYKNRMIVIATSVYGAICIILIQIYSQTTLLSTFIYSKQKGIF